MSCRVLWQIRSCEVRAVVLPAPVEAVADASTLSSCQTNHPPVRRVDTSALCPCWGELLIDTANAGSELTAGQLHSTGAARMAWTGGRVLVWYGALVVHRHRALHPAYHSPNRGLATQDCRPKSGSTSTACARSAARCGEYLALATVRIVLFILFDIVIPILFVPIFITFGHSDIGHYTNR